MYKVNSKDSYCRYQSIALIYCKLSKVNNVKFCNVFIYELNLLLSYRKRILNIIKSKLQKLLMQMFDIYI